MPEPETKSEVKTDPSKFMSLGTVLEQLDGEKNTVGVIDGFEPGPTTVKYEGVEAKFRNRAKDDLLSVGDDDTTIFVASDEGELSFDFGPQFEKTIVTNLKRRQLKLALSRLRGEGELYTTGDFTVHFDHAGPIVFNGSVTVATTPVRFPWDFGSHERTPSGPCGPTVGGGSP